MKVVKVGEGGWFVPSYSEQTLAPAYNTAATVQTLSGTVVADQGWEQDDPDQAKSEWSHRFY